MICSLVSSFCVFKKEEIEVTRTNLFKAIKVQGVTTDTKGYMRKSCSSPLVVDVDQLFAVVSIAMHVNWTHHWASSV